MDNNQQKSGTSVVGVIVALLGLLAGGAALFVGKQQHQAAQDEIKDLQQQVTKLSEAAGKLGIVEERLNTLQSRNDELAKRTVTAKQFTNIVNDFQYSRAALHPVLVKLDAISAGTNVSVEVRRKIEQLAVLEARLAAFYSKAIPYSPEELSLLQISRAGIRQIDLKRLSELNADAGRAYREKRHADAEKIYIEMLRINPKDHLSIANLATVQMELNKLGNAEQNLQRVLSVHPDDAKTVALMGLVKLRQQKIDDAMVYLGRAAALDPKNAETHNYLGIVLSQKGQRKEAETAFRRALSLDSNYAVAHFNLAVHYVTGKPPAGELAKWHYDKAVKAGHPRQPQVEKLLQAAP